MADKQFYEFKLEADTTTESGSLPFINDLFLDIVNYDEVNPYYYNSGYKERLDHVNEEKSQRARFGLTKMLPYQRIKLWKWSGANIIEDTTDYEITDAVFVDGIRYLMAVYDNYTKMKIFKQLFVDELQSCANNEYESGFAGKFVDISNYTYTDETGTVITQQYYPYNRCCDFKFTVAAWGKGKRKQIGTSGYMKVERVGDDVFYYFYDDNEIINAAAGDYLYINQGGLSGQIVPISGSTTIDGHQGVQTIFAWTGVPLQEGENFGLSSPHGWAMFETYGDIIHFSCADGILHLNYSNETPAETEVTVCGSMYTNTNNNTNAPGFIISSMINFRPIDTIALYDVSDGDVKFGLPGFLKFYFKASNQFFVSKDFTDITEFTDYIVLVGPSKTGLSYPYIDNDTPGVVRNLYRDIGDGYLTRGSWISDGTTFILANSKGLRALELDATYSVESRFGIIPSWKFQAGPFITDISQFSRELGDVMGMSMENKQFKMFISNEEGTIVWIKSIEHNYWRQHIIPNIVDDQGNIIETTRISRLTAGVYVGNGVFDRGGDTEVKTYISFAFGDKSMMIPKMFHSLKLALGRDSWLSKNNTILQITYVLSGREYTINYGDRDTSMWIQEMMNLKQTGNEDQVYRQYQNEIEISSGDGHGKPVPHRLYNVNKLRAFREYDPQRETISDYNDTYVLANRSTLHTDLGYMGDMITFKLFTKGNNNLEFYGAQIWYDLTNEVGGSLDNSLVVKASADDGSSPIVPK